MRRWNATNNIVERHAHALTLVFSVRVILRESIVSVVGTLSMYSQYVFWIFSYFIYEAFPHCWSRANFLKTFYSKDSKSEELINSKS